VNLENARCYNKDNWVYISTHGEQSECSNFRYWHLTVTYGNLLNVMGISEASGTGVDKVQIHSDHLANLL